MEIKPLGSTIVPFIWPPICMLRLLLKYPENSHVIIIIIISILKEDNVFSMTAGEYRQTLIIFSLFSDCFIFASVAK